MPTATRWMGCSFAAAHAVEHYEISCYGTLRTWAKELGMDQAVDLVDATLGEEIGF